VETTERAWKSDLQKKRRRAERWRQPGKPGNQTNRKRDREQKGGDNQENLEIRLTEEETENQ
jgi:hypothetical protein